MTYYEPPAASPRTASYGEVTRPSYKVEKLTYESEPGITIPRHRHDQEEIVLVEQGEMWVEIDGVRHHARPGQTVIIPARAVHAWGTLQERVQIVFVWPMPDPFAPGKSSYIDGTPPITA